MFTHMYYVHQWRREYIVKSVILYLNKITITILNILTIPFIPKLETEYKISFKTCKSKKPKLKLNRNHEVCFLLAYCV